MIATLFLKRSDGFSKPLPTAIMAIDYPVVFSLLSLRRRTIPTGIAYAIWSGIGIVLIASMPGWCTGKRSMPRR